MVIFFFGRSSLLNSPEKYKITRKTKLVFFFQLLCMIMIDVSSEFKMYGIRFLLKVYPVTKEEVELVSYWERALLKLQITFAFCLFWKLLCFVKLHHGNFSNQSCFSIIFKIQKTSSNQRHYLYQNDNTP